VVDNLYFFSDVIDFVIILFHVVNQYLDDGLVGEMNYMFRVMFKGGDWEFLFDVVSVFMLLPDLVRYN
jgi:hypothetical protein